MATIDKLIVIQEELRSQLYKAKVNHKKSPKDRLTKQHIESRLKLVETKWTKFTRGHYEILSKPEDHTEHSYFKDDVYDEVEEFYLDFVAELKVILDSQKSSPTSPSQEGTEFSKRERYPSIKLPTIIIPTFKGEYTEWMSFRDLFTSLIHYNAEIEDVQKLHYLKSHIAGEPEQLLRHIPLTNNNYLQCWNLLVHRYNNKQYLANCILKRFFAQRIIQTESSTALKELLDTTTDTLHALVGLGIDVTSWDIMIIYIVSLKLDQESRKQWEGKVSEFVSNSDNNLPTFKQFQEFLETRYHSLLFLDPKQGNYKGKYYNSNPYHKNTIQTLHLSSVSCPYCNEEHRISHCKKFCNLNHNEKRNFVQTARLCFNCLASNHSVVNCRNVTSCHVCRKRHHSLLHPKGTSESSGRGNSADVHVALPGTSSAASHLVSQSKETSAAADIRAHFSKGCMQSVLLATAVVKAETKSENHYQLLRALIDQGSQASFITTAAAHLLGLKGTATRGVISGLGGDPNIVSKSVVEVKIQSLHNPSCIIHVRAYVLDKLTSFLPAKHVEITSWPELAQLTLADPSYHTPTKIDLLLGAEVYGQIIIEGLVKSPSGTTVAQNTSLGWILSGQVASKSLSCNVVSMHTQLEESLKLFWEMEKEPETTQKILTEEEQKCESYFNLTTKRDQEGRYIVKLPFKEEDPTCKYGNSREIAKRRFYSRERKLERDSNLKSEYKKIINEYLELNHMEPVPEDEEQNIKERSVYIPYHEVIREGSLTTAVRIVFDASCKGTNGASLNDNLMVGPKLQPELRHLIMNWRKYPIVFTADIIKMYRQIKVDESDANYQRIVWREEPNQDLKEFKLVRLTFGTASAPYLAVKCLMQLAEDEGMRYPLASERIKKEFYMDDLMSGAEEEEEILEIYVQLNELLKRGGFHLQKWVTNSNILNNKLKEGEEKGELDKKLVMKQEKANKILGLTWNTEGDEFEYSVQIGPFTWPVTKRKVIADIARLYDPLGWIAPCVVKAKIFIQKLWLSGIDWDENLPPQLLDEWIKYREDLCNLTNFRLPRWYNTRRDDTCVELHGFSDASNAAFGAVIYIRVVNSSGEVNVNLVTAKTKVAPIKQISIPRLELNGAVLLSKLLVEVSKILDIPRCNVKAWTDSEIVLAWLSSHPSRWKTYIANRVSEIISVLDRKHWDYVKSEHNPADCASRGIKPTEISNHTLWLNGPIWLKDKIITHNMVKNTETNLEEKTIKTLTISVTDDQDDEMWSKCASLNKLLRVVAYCRRVLKENRKKHTYLLKEEIDNALNIVIKKCQQKEFLEEINSIKKGHSIKKSSKLTSYNPYLDELGLLRVGGRLQNADIHEYQKHPILVPHDSRLAQLLVADAHIKTLHGGPQIMLNYIRSKYWIFGAKKMIKHHIRKCVICIRYTASHKNQPLMGQLPSSRVKINKPFRCAGVDYAGPINMRVSKGRGNRSYKGYICLFICMATRAIHLEAVSDLTSEGFLAAFRRFVARRGYCSDLHSDNGTNFVGAARELSKLLDAENSKFVPEIRDWLATNGTRWHFIPPHSPNFGGLWEAGVKSAKYHLNRIVGNSTLTYEEMSTVLSQVEACLNSRPISYIQDQGEPMPLTPGHFLIGEPLLVAPDDKHESTIGSLRRWQLCQRMLQDFWKRWSEEYLTRFLQRHKWNESIPEPNIGDVVLVKEPDLPPARWLLGRIVEKHPGLDKVTRVVTLKYKNKFIKRPTSKICILPISD